MAVFTYEDVIPTLIENTTMTRTLKDGAPYMYRISPVSGYVLHDNRGNWIDPYTHVEYEAYFSGTCTCNAAYDFTANPREFYAVPADSVPADQIFGRVDDNNEVM